MREGELRIALERLVQQAKSLFAIFARIAGAAPTKEIARSQEKFIGRHVRGRMNLEAGFFARRQVGAERESDPPRQLALELEQIGDFAIVGIVPNMLICPGIDQLGVDPHPITFAPDGALHDVGHAERFADLAEIARRLSCTAERKCGWSL